MDVYGSTSATSLAENGLHRALPAKPEMEIWLSNLCGALNCQSTDENRTRISQLTTEILQRKHGPTLQNYCTPQNFQRPLLKNINGDPMLSVPFYTADWNAYLLAKANK